jgi:uncharacterized membrane protein YphA (DoxX/SURF4 family)
LLNNFYYFLKMKCEKYKKFAPILLRVGMSLIFLWFGFNQILDTQTWVGWLPTWAYNSPISPGNLILFNGFTEVILGGLMLVGKFTKVVSFLLGLHLLGITFNIGYNDTGIRDFGLTIATFTVFLQGPDKWCLDTRKKHER